MKFLNEIYGTYNIASYPEPVRQMIETHKVQCLRRHYKLNQTKIILALPWQSRLTEYINEISTSQINIYYDHVISIKDHSPRSLPDQPLDIANPEEYLIKSEPPKNKRAPKGIRIEITEDLQQVTEMCIQHWFSTTEVYWTV